MQLCGTYREHVQLPGKTAHGCLRVKLLFLLGHPFLVHTCYYIRMHCIEDTKYPGSGNQRVLMYDTKDLVYNFNRYLS